MVCGVIPLAKGSVIGYEINSHDQSTKSVLRQEEHIKGDRKQNDSWHPDLLFNAN